MEKRFTGKYKGTVVSVDDPSLMGRVKVSIPAVHDNYISGWCTPCYSYDGDFHLPKVGSAIMVEFMNGDLSKPVWTGGWYREGTAYTDGKRHINYEDTIQIESEKSIEINAPDGVFINGINILSLLG